MNASEYIASLDFSDTQEVSGEPSQDLLSHTPRFIAERETESRIDRLHMVWGHAQATAASLSNHYQRHWNGAIVELADYKGTLYVTWRDEISRVMFEGVILGAWEANGEHMHAHRLA